MSESRKKVDPVTVFLSPENIKYVKGYAEKEATSPRGGGRAFSRVTRAMLDFTEAHDALFLTWITTRRSHTSGSEQEQQ